MDGGTLIDMQDKTLGRQSKTAVKNLYQVPVPKSVFTIAVTGHRNLGTAKQVKALENTVAGFLRTFRQMVDDVEPQTECRMLTALAAGADQLAADAIELGEPLLPWNLHVILPFEKSAYRTTLGHGLAPTAAINIQTEFDRLLELGDQVFEIADWELPTSKNLTDLESYWKNTRFQTLGELLIRQADVLLAIWEGTPPAGAGGTADVVAMALRHGVPVVRIDPKTRMLSLLIGKPGTEDAVSCAQKCFGQQALSQVEEKDLKAIIKKVLHLPQERPAASSPEDQKTKDGHASIKAFLGVSKHGIGPETAGRYTWWFIYKNFAWIFLLFSGQVKWPGLRLRVDYGVEDWGKKKENSLSFLEAVDDGIKPAMTAADAIATANGHAYRSCYVITFLGAVLAVWLGLFGLFVGEQKWLWVSFEVLMLSLILFFYFKAKKGDWHRRWLNARHVTESLRGSRFLAWLGFGGRRPIADDAPWTAWLANAVMAGPGIPQTKFSPTHIAEISKDLREFHVVGQRDYHKKNHAELERLHHRLDVTGWGCVGISIVIAVFYVGVFGWGKCYGNTECLAWSGFAKYLVTLAGAGLPLLAAALAGIRYQADFERFGQRSHKTAIELDKICERLKTLEEHARKTGKFCGAESEPLFEELAKIISDLSKIYESDLDDWRFVYSARPNPGVG